MDKRLSRSYIERDPSTINQTYIITVDSINYYFKFVYDSLQDNRIIQDSNLSSSYFVLKSYDEIHEMKLNQLREIERYASFDILSSIEAKFMVDYYVRCENRLKDDISREFRIRNE